MGLFDDVSRFLEARLDEFLRTHPELELQAIEEQLRQQELDTKQLITDLQQQEKQVQDQILETAQEVQRWHIRVEKAQQFRPDLVEPAQQREAALLRQGNQLWGQMKGYQERIQKAKELLNQVQLRRKEVQAKVTEAQATSARNPAQAPSTGATTGWSQTSTPPPRNSADPLEHQFREWELQRELDEMKRQMGK